MVDAAALSDKFIDAYNRYDFDAMGEMMVEDLDFAHFNRDFEMHSSTELLNTLRTFAADYFVERKFASPEKIVVDGNSVVRIAWYSGKAKVDLPGFGNAGDEFRFKFSSFIRFNDDGKVVEWKDFG